MSTRCREIYMRSAHSGVVTSSGTRSRTVEGNTVSYLIDDQTLLLKEVHLDGQGRCTSVVARTRRLHTAK
jgi:hypothetical protein